MARLLDDAASEYMENAAAIATAVPISMACWFNSDSIALSQYLMCIGNSASTAKFALGAMGAVASDPIQAITSSNVAASTAGYSANTWSHAAAVFASITSRAAYLNGGNKGTNATSTTPAGVNRTALGCKNDSTRSNFLSGMIAEAAIWNVALTDADVLVLSLGFSPLCVRPDALLGYWPVVGRYSPEISLKGGFDMTLTGTANAAHPRILYPVGIGSVGVAAAAAAADAVPQAWAQYRHRRAA